VVCVPCCVSPPGCWAAKRRPTNKQPNQCNNTTKITQHPHHTQRLSMHCCMWCVLCVACRLRVTGLSGEAPRANNARPQHNQHYTTPKPYETHVDSVLYVVCVLRVACRLRVVALPGETPQATNPRQHNNQHCTTSKPYETPVDSVLYVMFAVCCMDASGLLGRRVKTNEQTTQCDNTTNITQHPNHTKRLSIRCCMRCVLRIACRLWLAGQSAPNPTSKQPKATTQPTLLNTQTIRSACQFSVVSGVCCMLHVASGLLGCRPPSPASNQPKATKQATLHNTQTIRNAWQIGVVCGVCSVLCVCHLRVAGPSGENTVANNTM
jgi:hypothetical protein